MNIVPETDILIVGGGTAGTIAAIQAGRVGAKTLLVNRGTQLGGTTTTGSVSFPGLFHAWGKQIISVIGWDLVMDTVLHPRVFMENPNGTALVIITDYFGNSIDAENVMPGPIQNQKWR